MSLIEQLKHFADSQPAQPALTAGNDASISYQQLWQHSQYLANQIAGAVKGVDMLVVITHRNALQVISLLAGLQLKCPVAIVDLRQGSERLIDIMQQGHRLLCIVDAQGDKVLAPLVDEARLPQVQHYYLLEPLSQDTSLTIIQRELAQPQPRAASLAALPDDTALILYTSGSTGSPKGVCISAADLNARLQAEQAWFELSNSDTILGVLPLNFDVGVTQLLGTLYAGAHHVLANSWLPADIFHHIQARTINGLAMSPMVWRQLLKTKEPAKLWLAINQLRYVTLSGGTVDSETLEHIANQLTSATLIKTYGQTEMFRIASLKINANNFDAALLNSVGRAYSGVELSIVDERGEPVPAGTYGEIIASGMGQMAAYVPSIGDNIEATQRIHTGDRGRLDTAGNLFIEGRQNDMVKIFDQRIFPDDVANSLQNILGIRPIAVLATEADEPKLVAFIEQDSTEQCSDEKESPEQSDQALKAQLRGKIAGHLIPYRFERLSALPSTANGKIDKLALRKQL